MQITVRGVDYDHPMGMLRVGSHVIQVTKWTGGGATTPPQIGAWQEIPGDAPAAETSDRITALRFIGAARIGELEDFQRMLDGEIAARGQGSLDIVTSRGVHLRARPPGGATLSVYWCTDPAASETWYPTYEAARAVLVALARAEGRAITEGRDHLDLTRPGCQSSEAWVRRWAGSAETAQLRTEAATLHAEIAGDMRAHVAAHPEGTTPWPNARAWYLIRLCFEHATLLGAAS